MPRSTRTPARRDLPRGARLALAGLALLGLPACLAQDEPALPGTTEPQPAASTPRAAGPGPSDPAPESSGSPTPQASTSVTLEAARGTPSASASESASADYADSAGASGSLVDCAHEYSYLADLATDRGTIPESRMWELTREMAEAQRLAESGDETSAHDICRMVVDDIRYELDQG